MVASSMYKFNETNGDCDRVDVCTRYLYCTDGKTHSVLMLSGNYKLIRMMSKNDSLKILLG